MNTKEKADIQAMSQEIDSVKSVMKKNLELSLQKDEELDNLSNSVNELSTRANIFKKLSKKVKKKFCLENCDKMVLIGLGILVVVGVIVIILVA